MWEQICVRASAILGLDSAESGSHYRQQAVSDSATLQKQMAVARKTLEQQGSNSPRTKPVMIVKTIAIRLVCSSPTTSKREVRLWLRTS